MGSGRVKLRRLLRFPDNVRFQIWKQMKLPGVLQVRLRGEDGPTLLLRPGPTHDRGIAREIFAEEMYALPAAYRAEAAAPAWRTIVDLGANVGYSILYFLRAHPEARVIAFEPHPAHVACIRRHLVVNGVEAKRVELHAVAGGAAAAHLTLTDAGATSEVVTKSAGAGGIPVEVVDIFPLVQELEIDLMKIDIEGGEYAIIDDPRFARLKVRWLVMECHRTDAVGEPYTYCQERLKAAGYEVMSRPEGAAAHTEGRTSLLWARRR